jgi:CDP-ribitol ribitolphosphotransferase
VIDYTAVVCSSAKVAPYWAEAFGLPAERVLPLGSPRVDALRELYDKQALRMRFDAKHLQCKGKRLFLYAPTFREDPAQNAALLSHFDFAAFGRRFGGEAVLLLRMHPAMHGTYTLPTNVIDLTDIPDPLDLLRVCDRFITDYSSLCFAAAALDLPIVIYAFDEMDYMQGGRGFYVPLRKLPPGPVCNDFIRLLDILDAPDNSQTQRAAFAAFHLGAMDGQSCRRIMEAFFE